MKKIGVKAIALSVAMLAGGTQLAQANSMSDSEIQAMIERVVNKKTASLQRKVRHLQAEVRTLRKQRVTQPGIQGTSGIRTAAGRPIYPRTTVQVPGHLSKAEASGFRAHTHGRLNPQTTSLTTEDLNQVLTGLYFGGSPVVTSPFLGERSAFDGSDLITNLGSINLDRQILRQEQALEDALASRGMPIPEHPLIEISGSVQAAGVANSEHPGNTNADIDLAAVELDVYAQANRWVFAFFDFVYEAGRTTPYRIGNSRVFVDKGFITLGNLNHSPFYATLGQLYVPFGKYSSNMVTDPVTKPLGRTKARTAIFGFTPRGKTGFYGAAYVFRSDTRSKDRGTSGGVDFGLKASHNDWKTNAAVDFISNIADSQGLQRNGAPVALGFRGFATSSATENIYHAVPGLNVHGSVSYKHFTLLGEYVRALRHFDSRALTFNGRAAKPSALHVEGSYEFNLHGKPGNIALGYGRTNDALALLLPHHSYMAAINYSFWRSTLASLEFRHDINYDASDRASGGGFKPFGPQYRHANSVALQLAVFF